MVFISINRHGKLVYDVLKAKGYRSVFLFFELIYG